MKSSKPSNLKSFNKNLVFEVKEAVELINDTKSNFVLQKPFSIFSLKKFCSA